MLTKDKKKKKNQFVKPDAHGRGHHVDVVPNKAGKEWPLIFMFQNIVKARKLLWMPLLALGLTMVKGPLLFKSHRSKCKMRRMLYLFSLGGLLIQSRHWQLAVCRKSVKA
ncbi:hypothetical protein M0R45_016409 [Rubus argutus]|uniref:Uncharacterized protein n=1 Tax=Rubus argutus TaxID=59490 RepID=A0AAW1XUY7_RUBAR